MQQVSESTHAHLHVSAVGDGVPRMFWPRHGLPDSPSAAIVQAFLKKLLIYELVISLSAIFLLAGVLTKGELLIGVTPLIREPLLQAVIDR